MAPLRPADLDPGGEGLGRWFYGGMAPLIQRQKLLSGGQRSAPIGMPDMLSPGCDSPDTGGLQLWGIQAVVTAPRAELPTVRAYFSRAPVA